MHQLEDFRQWFPIARVSVGDMPRHGAISAVYALRLRPDEEIVYIGSTYQLRRRILGNHMCGIGSTTTAHIHELLFNEGNIDLVDISWIETATYGYDEEQLKNEFHQRYGHTPVWN